MLSGTRELEYQVQVDDDDAADGVTLRNHITSVGSNCPPNPRTEGADCTTEHHTPHYVLTKTSDPASGTVVDAGTDVVYTLEVTNDSDAVLSGAVVTDDLSNVVNNASDPFDTSGGVTYDAGGQQLTWSVPTLQPGESASISYTVTIDAGAWGVTIGNVATPDEVGDCVDGCSTEHPTPHWTLAKTSIPTSGSTVDAGTSVEYTLWVTNDSDANLTGATVTDDLSDVLDDATLQEPLPAGLSVDGTTLTWAVPDLGPGESVLVSYTVQIDADAWGVTLRNVATPGQPSGDCVNECTTDHFTPYWTLEKTSAPPSGSTVQAGTDVTYTLTVRNDSEADVIGATVTDDLSNVLNSASIDEGMLPAGLSLNDDDPLNPFLVWAVPDLEPGQPASVSYTVHIDADASGVTIGNHATPDQPSGECVADCSTEHFTPAYVLEKVSDPVSGSEVLPPYLGDPADTIEYTLAVTNTGPVPLTSATVTDDLSDVLDDATLLEPLAAGLVLNGTTLTWTVPTPIPVQGSAQVSYTLQLDEGAWATTLHNSAESLDDYGRCIAPDACETTHTTPPLTTLVVKKVDLELLDEPLEGATFTLWRDNAPFSPTIPATIGPEDIELASEVTSADGLAKFPGLRPGRFLVKETVPPPGYGLLEVDTIAVEIVEGVDGNFVAGGEMTPILFRDPAEGQIAIIAKRQYELTAQGEWEESDGIVEHGDVVKYVVGVQATGPKIFHDVRLSDFVPGFNPVDGTSTGQGTLVPGSTACTGDLECEVTVEDNLITWHAGTMRNSSGAVEFVIDFPSLPLPVPYDESLEYTTTLWNVGYLDWDEVVTSGVNPVPSRSLTMAHHRLTSNEVVVKATVTTRLEPNEADEPDPGPRTLPDTGASESAQTIGLLGGLAVMIGGALVLFSRRQEAS